MDEPAATGPIALVGSGEYLPQMENIDRLLLEHVGGTSARVVVLATAAGLEAPTSPQRWSRMGVEHFARLGARATPVGILVRDDAFDPRWLSVLEAADFIYFSGGSPQHLIQTLENSPAWEVIRARHAAGAVLAGCSAGAMAFGALTLQPRALWLVLVLGYCGLRFGEATALRVADVDLSARRIRVRRSITYVRKTGLVEGPHEEPHRAHGACASVRRPSAARRRPLCAPTNGVLW